MARPKGSTNHQSKMLKDMILAALNEVGGKDYLIRQADENAAAFMTLVGKIVPKEVDMEVRQKAIEQIAKEEGLIEHDPSDYSQETEG